jgi:hypothetical protein
MADDFGRIHPVSQHFLNRGAREEPYPGKQPRKHTGKETEGAADEEADAVDESVESASGTLIDLRI